MSQSAAEIFEGVPKNWLRLFLDKSNYPQLVSLIEQDKLTHENMLPFIYTPLDNLAKVIFYKSESSIYSGMSLHPELFVELQKLGCNIVRFGNAKQEIYFFQEISKQGILFLHEKESLQEFYKFVLSKVEFLEKLPEIDWSVRHNYIFTDGACGVKHPRSAGWAMAFVNGKTCFLEYASSRRIKDGDEELELTNQQAEGLAILNALKFLRKKRFLHDAVIITDSQFWIDLITNWMHKWYERSPDFSSKAGPNSKIANRELVSEIYKYWTLCNNKTHSRLSYLQGNNSIEFIHVNSHRKPPSDKTSFEFFLWQGNQLVDHFACIAKKEFILPNTIIPTQHSEDCEESCEGPLSIQHFC